MSRLMLLLCQLAVALVALALWQFFATVPVFGKILLPPFFFSNPVDVFSQIVKWFSSGVIWKHLFITLWESILAFVIGSVSGAAVGFCFARQPLVAAGFDPYVKMVNALPRIVLAPVSWHSTSSPSSTPKPSSPAPNGPGGQSSSKSARTQ